MKDMMFGKKKKVEMDPIEKEAKMSAVSAMKQMAEDAMSDKLGGLKKVTVAADSEEGLKEGLEKAEDVVESKLEPEMEGEEMESEEGSELADMSEEEIDKKLQELMALKAKLKA